MPIAQVLVSAAKANPPPMPAASHLSFGTAMLPRMLDSTIDPATQAHLTFQVPALGAAVDRETFCRPGGDPAVEDVHVGQTRVAQRLLGLHGALTRATHQHDVVVEVLDDLVAVLTQQIQRNVVGPGDVGGLELARGSDVENPRRRSRTKALAEVAANRWWRGRSCRWSPSGCGWCG